MIQIINNALDRLFNTHTFTMSFENTEIINIDMGNMFTWLIIGSCLFFIVNISWFIVNYLRGKIK